jgi:hypothetical protein
MSRFVGNARAVVADVIAALISCTGLLQGLWAQTGVRKPAPVVGKSLRYCNPLPIVASSQDGSPQGVSLGDVTIVREGDSYYIFNTGGGAWSPKISWTGNISRFRARVSLWPLTS